MSDRLDDTEDVEFDNRVRALHEFIIHFFTNTSDSIDDEDYIRLELLRDLTGTMYFTY
jgi:hypothetical protein